MCVCVRMCLYESVCTTMLKIKQRSTRKLKNQSRINQKSIQNRPKIDPRSIQNRSKIGSGADLASETVPGSILTPFWTQLEAILGGKMEPCRGHVCPKLDFWRVWNAQENKHDFQHLCGASWGRFWADFWSQNRPQIVPESVSRANKPEKQKC